MFHSNLYTGKTKAPKDIATLTTARFFLVFLSFVFMITSGCVKKETPKKVSLKKKSVEKVGEVDYPLQDTLWFGFDLRLDPKEDFRTYIPLLKYLEGATDRRFRIKFSGKSGDTVRPGQGVTMLLLSRPLYHRGRMQSNIWCGVNKEGDATYYSMYYKPKKQYTKLKGYESKCLLLEQNIDVGNHTKGRCLKEGITLRLRGCLYWFSLDGRFKRECDAGSIQTLAKT
jgi:hypothetical protein